LPARNSHVGLKVRIARSNSRLQMPIMAVASTGEQTFMSLYRIVGLATLSLAILVVPAFAGPSASAPGPIAGIGLPALVLIGGAYWAGRKLLARKK